MSVFNHLPMSRVRICEARDNRKYLVVILWNYVLGGYPISKINSHIFNFKEGGYQPFCESQEFPEEARLYLSDHTTICTSGFILKDHDTLACEQELLLDPYYRATKKIDELNAEIKQLKRALGPTCGAV